MSKTVVGLFESTASADDAIREMEGAGIPKKEIQTLQEPGTFDVTGVMSFPRIDFETDLSRELMRIGATVPEAQSYVEGLRRGGALCFATGSDSEIETAGLIMSRHGAKNVEHVDGSEPHLPVVAHRSMAPKHDSGVLTGRVRGSGSGPSVFVW